MREPTTRLGIEFHDRPELDALRFASRQPVRTRSRPCRAERSRFAGLDVWQVVNSGECECAASQARAIRWPPGHLSRSPDPEASSLPARPDSLIFALRISRRRSVTLRQASRPEGSVSGHIRCAPDRGRTRGRRWPAGQHQAHRAPPANGLNCRRKPTPVLRDDNARRQREASTGPRRQRVQGGWAEQALGGRHHVRPDLG